MFRSRKFIVAAVVGALAVVAFLAFGVFGIQTAFIDDTVSEENPFASVAAIAVSEPAESVESAEPVDVADAGQAESAPDAPAETETSQSVREAASAEEESSSEPAPVATEVPAAPQVVTLGTGMLVDHEHSGTGTATVLSDGTQTFLRFEDDFAIDNGPDLNVYLVRGADAEGDPGLFDDDFIDLGDLKGNIGAQNYELPAGVNIDEYSTVVIWCVRFGVAFNAANLA